MSRFFVYGILPPLEFGSRPDIAAKSLTEIFDLNLSKADLKKVYVLKLWIDVLNLYGTFGKNTFDARGNYSKSTLKSLIANEEDLPLYVFDFFHRYEKEEDRRRYFPELMARYFQQEREKHSGSLQEFLRFEHDIRVLLAGYRAKRSGVDLAKELQFEDPSDPVVAAVLLQKDRAGAFQMPSDYEELEEVVNQSNKNPSKEYEGVAEFRFKFYIKYFNEYPFSLKGVLAYMMALWILEDLFALKQEDGEKLLGNIVERENVS